MNPPELAICDHSGPPSKPVHRSFIMVYTRPASDFVLPGVSPGASAFTDPATKMVPSLLNAMDAEYFA